MDRIKSHLIPVLIVGALGAAGQFVLFVATDQKANSPIDFVSNLAFGALAAQVVACFILMWFDKIRQAAIFGTLLFFASCIWGFVEAAFGIMTGWWLGDDIQSFVQAVVVPVVFATIMLVTGRPKALFSMKAKNVTSSSLTAPATETPSESNEHSSSPPASG